MSRSELILGSLLTLFAVASTPVSAEIATTLSCSQIQRVSIQERNKAVARRVFDEILSQGKFQVAEEIYSWNFVNHGLHRDASLEEDQAAARWEKRAFPDLNMTVDLMFAEEDLVTVIWRARGTNTASASPLPATGAQIELKGITVFRVVDGRIREEWTSFDMLRAVRQLADQLKWKLFAMSCAVVVLLWGLCRAIRRKWFRFSTS